MTYLFKARDVAISDMEPTSCLLDVNFRILVFATESILTDEPSSVNLLFLFIL